MDELNDMDDLDDLSVEWSSDSEEDEYVDVDDEVDDEGYVEEHDDNHRIIGADPGVEPEDSAAVQKDSGGLLPVVTPSAPVSRRRADSIDVEDTLTLERARALDRRSPRVPRTDAARKRAVVDANVKKTGRKQGTGKNNTGGHKTTAKKHAPVVQGGPERRKPGTTKLQKGNLRAWRRSSRSAIMDSQLCFGGKNDAEDPFFGGNKSLSPTAGHRRNIAPTTKNNISSGGSPRGSPSHRGQVKKHAPFFTLAAATSKKKRSAPAQKRHDSILLKVRAAALGAERDEDGYVLNLSGIGADENEIEEALNALRDVENDDEDHQLPSFFREVRIDRNKLGMRLPLLLQWPLVKLDVSYNSLLRAPEIAVAPISELSCTLQCLVARGLQLQGLPEEWGLLSNLRHLDLGQNKLHQWPDVVESLLSLQVLELDCNSLVDVPRSIASLTLLERLGVADNELATLDDALFALPRLRHLDASRNAQLVEVSAKMADLASREGVTICLSDNAQLKCPPASVADIGAKEIAAFFDHLKVADTALESQRRRAYVARRDAELLKRLAAIESRWLVNEQQQDTPAYDQDQRLLMQGADPDNNMLFTASCPATPTTTAPYTPGTTPGASTTAPLYEVDSRRIAALLLLLEREAAADDSRRSKPKIRFGNISGSDSDNASTTTSNSVTTPVSVKKRGNVRRTASAQTMTPLSGIQPVYSTDHHHQYQIPAASGGLSRAHSEPAGLQTMAAPAPCLFEEGRRTPVLRRVRRALSAQVDLDDARRSLKRLNDDDSGLEVVACFSMPAKITVDAPGHKNNGRTMSIPPSKQLELMREVQLLIESIPACRREVFPAARWPEDLLRLPELKPRIFHFGGHCVNDANWTTKATALIFQSDFADSTPSAGAVVDLLSKCEGLELCFLNACFSDRLGREILRGIPSGVRVICWSTAVLDAAARCLATAFYECIGDRPCVDVTEAFEVALKTFERNFVLGDPSPWPRPGFERRPHGIPILLTSPDD